jgi:N-acetylmuramoyl-L-alanine amidase
LADASADAPDSLAEALAPRPEGALSDAGGFRQIFGDGFWRVAPRYPWQGAPGAPGSAAADDGEVSDLYGAYEQWRRPANGGKGWVILDAGHGGVDPGASSQEIVEKDITLAVTLRTAELLAAEGVDYVLTRAADQTAPVVERIRLANHIPAAFYISVHCDWFEDARIQGTATLYSGVFSRGLGAARKALAATIQAHMTEGLKTVDRGITPNDNILILRELRVPSALVELAFLSNRADAKLLKSAAFKEKAAQNLANGILAALAQTSVPSTVRTAWEPSVDPAPPYRHGDEQPGAGR